MVKEKRVAFDFTDDKEKMRDFVILSKREFLESYSYLTAEDYNLTAKIAKEKGIVPPTAQQIRHKVVELCPHCGQEVRIRAIKHAAQPCPNCGEPIRACSLCDHDTCDCNACDKEDEGLCGSK